MHALRTLRAIKLCRGCVAHVENCERRSEQRAKQGQRKCEDGAKRCEQVAKNMRRSGEEKYPKVQKWPKSESKTGIFDQKWNPKPPFWAKMELWGIMGGQNEL